MSTFAVVIYKAEAASKFQAKRAASDIACEYLLQRLERRATKDATEIVIVHDEGDRQTVRKRCRKARRAGTAGSQFGTGELLSVPFTRLLDDAVPRDSAQSYFLQLADMSAYAVFRRIHPPPQRRQQIVPTRMWDLLGDARFAPVRRTWLWGGPTAIVKGP